MVFGIFPFLYSGYCKWSTNAKIPVFPPEGVSPLDTPPLPETPPLESFVYFRNIMTSLCNTSASIRQRFKQMLGDMLRGGTSVSG